MANPLGAGRDTGGRDRGKRLRDAPPPGRGPGRTDDRQASPPGSDARGRRGRTSPPRPRPLLAHWLRPDRLVLEPGVLEKLVSVSRLVDVADPEVQHAPRLLGIEVAANVVAEQVVGE